MMKRFRRASGSLVAAACVAVRVEPGASVGSGVSGLSRLRGLLALSVLYLERKDIRAQS